MRTWLTTFMVLALASCGQKDAPPPPPRQQTASPPASAKGPSIPMGSRAPIRLNAAAGPVVEGIALEARAFVSKLTTADAIGVAVRLKRDEGSPDARADQSIKRVSALRFEVKPPSGPTKVLEAQLPDGDGSWRVSDYLERFDVRAAELVRNATKVPWKAPVPALLEAPGNHEVTVVATFAIGDRTVELRSGPLALDVAAPSDARKPLAEIESAATKYVGDKLGGGKLGAPSSEPTIDDADGVLSMRFDANPSRSDYTKELAEVWIDPTAKVVDLDVYNHFTCVAAGTEVATPRGPIAIERS